MKDLALEKKFIKFCESLSFPVLVFDPDMRVISANKVFLERYKLGLNQVLKKKCQEIFFPSKGACTETECPIDFLFAEKRSVSRIKKTVRPDGSDLYQDFIYSPILDDDGEVEYIVTTIKDVTRSKHMEADLRKTKDFLEKIIESSGHGIVVADMKGAVLLMNESARELFGYTNEKVGVAKIYARDHYAPGEAENVMEKLRSPDYGGVGRLHSAQMEVMNSSGEAIPVEVTASIIYEDGEEIATMAIFQDLRPKIEAEKKLEKARRQLVQAEKMASVGRLAAGVAHELNNPLGGIIMYSLLALEQMPQEGMAYENLKKVVALGERCKKIVKGLLDFSRQREPEMERVDVNEIIEETFSLLKPQALFQNIDVVKSLDPALPPIMGDRSHLQQVFMNLSLNAAEAMEEGGQLMVVSSCRGGEVEVAFQDTGCGIPPEDIEKVFEPFFTRKSDQNGTGLGLAVSHGIISKHGGTISVNSKLGRGTTFTIKLPVKGI